MCLIALAWNAEPEHRLLLLANRDEYHARPSAPLSWWPDMPILAGRDLLEGGTWLGLSRQGRVAAVTNVRGADAGRRFARSRGALVTDFLRDRQPAADWAAALAPQAGAYGGFNLLLYDGRDLVYASNRPSFGVALVAPGIHALSNAALDTPWPKVTAARTRLQWALSEQADDDRLLDSMNDRHCADDTDLPDTGVGLSAERLLSPAFIRSDAYGTRCTSLLRLHSDGRVLLRERRYDAAGANSGETAQQLQLAAGRAQDTDG